MTHTASGKVFAVDSGAIIVAPSPVATSSWTAVVTAADAAILAYAANPHGSVTVDGFSFTFRSMSDLIALRSYAQNMAESETGGRFKRLIRARFT